MHYHTLPYSPAFNVRVCVYVRAYVNIYLSILLGLGNLLICVYVRAYIYIYIYMCVCVCVCVCAGGASVASIAISAANGARTAQRVQDFLRVDVLGSEALVGGCSSDVASCLFLHQQDQPLCILFMYI